MWPLLPPFLYAPSPVEAAMTASCSAAVAFLAISEFRGGHLPYSKFSRAAAPPLPSRVGMLVIYAPPLAAALASFAVPGVVDGPRAHLLAVAVSVHFLKRVLEVLFVHRYSGSMPLWTAMFISSSYLSNAISMIYVQQLIHGLPEPAVDLLYLGCGLRR